MEDARRQQEQLQDVDWKQAWAGAVDTTQQGETAAAAGLDDFGDREIMEQTRIMAEHEAHLRLKNTTGFDMEDHQKKPPVIGKIDEGYRKMLLTPRLPEPRRITVASSSMPKLQEPTLPSLPLEQTYLGTTSQITPDVSPGVLVAYAEEVPPEEKLLWCLGCQKKLRVKRKAMFASCPNCLAESPAISYHECEV